MNATNSPFQKVFLPLCAAAVPMGLAGQNASKGPPRYAVTDLGTLGGSFSLAGGIDAEGLMQKKSASAGRVLL